MKNRWMILLLLLLIFTTGCRGNSDKEIKTETEEKPEKLTVWVVADSVTEYYASEDREEIYYTTMMALGDFSNTTIEYGSKGFLFYDAFESFQEETGIQLDIRWYPYPEQMEEELKKTDLTQQPDVILSNFTSYADYYLYMEQGLFYDLMDLFEQNEMYSEGKYYNQVLEAGQFNHKQYLVPILFNVDTVMGAREIWNELGLYLDNAEKHSEFLNMLAAAQEKQSIGQVACQFNVAGCSYLPYIIYSSSGEKWIDYEHWTTYLDQTEFRNMCVFYKQYLKEQFEEGEIQPGERLPWAYAKHNDIWKQIINDVQLDEFLDDMGCIVEGGVAYQTFLHSAAAQAWYYESRYRDQNQEFVLAAIPGMNGGSTGHISYFGTVLQSSQYPQSSFEFVKYLMDAECAPYFGLSINRDSTARQFEYFTSSAYHLRPGLMVPLPDGTLADSSADYVIQPMSQDIADTLLQIIDTMETVSVPNYEVYRILEEPMIQYAREEIGLEDAYQAAKSGLEAYIKED